MGLFDRQTQEIANFLAARADRVLRLPFPAEPWPEEQSVVLEEDTAIELGKPSLGSLLLLVFHDGGGEDEILVLGPDLPEVREPSIPLAVIVTVRGSFPEEYESYRDLKAAVYDTRLAGCMIRVLPGQQTVWVRVSREARARGFSLAHLGSALIANLREVAGVKSVKVVFITSGRPDFEPLFDTAHDSFRIASALIKMTEEMSYDCDACDYQEVCDTVADLKKIRDKIAQRSGR